MSDELGNFRAFLRGDAHVQRFKDAEENGKFQILVGFPSGMPHIETVHEFDEKGERITHTKEGGDLAELAEDLHYGKANIPARPFLEDGISMNRDELRRIIAKEFDKLLLGGKPDLKKIAVATVGGIRDLVMNGYYRGTVPNAKMTIELKGSDTPLIDGANLIHSLHYALVQNGKVSEVTKVK